MRTRLLREGSVGLLVLLGVGFFLGLVAWLQGLHRGRTYQLIFEFEDAAESQVGTPVLYRGIEVGKIVRVLPKSNSVTVHAEIREPDLRIPQTARVEIENSLLLGDAEITIVPTDALVEPETLAGPLDPDCDSQAILCDGDRVLGQPPINFTALVRSVQQVADFVTSVEFQENIDQAILSVTDTSERIGTLSEDTSRFVQRLEGEVTTFRNTAESVTEAADAFAATSGEIARTADRAAGTLDGVDALVRDNRLAIADTLGNIAATSVGLRRAMDRLAPALDAASQRPILANLEAMSADAAQAAANIRDVTEAIDDPTTLLLMRQTLTSARSTFQNAEKLTADLDDLTGDPRFRESVREIVTGLGNLLSSAAALETQLSAVEESAGAGAEAGSPATGAPPPPQRPVPRVAGDRRDRTWRRSPRSTAP